ncbi:amidohydrolase family protein [Anaeromyxobacter sp. Red801]|uniref:amidohydrolase family protein n=1 Tax=Anaeromyxobacter sp. Red801 TaxID=3411632 RepID=UPI003B9F16E9
MPITRRSRIAAVTLATVAAVSLGAATLQGGSRAAVRDITVHEGTNVAVTASPDGRELVMDLQGVLWSLPRGGGEARRLTDGLLEPARPDFSPRGDLIAFQAYAGGTFHIWTMRPDGTEVRQLTSGHGDDREPRFSPDGTRIAFSSDRAFQGSYDVWVADVATGALTRWTDAPADEFEPAWTPGGGEIAFVSGAGSTGTAIEAVDAAGHRRTLATAPAGARLNSPSISPDGAHLAWIQFAANRSRLLVDGAPASPFEDVFPFPAHWLSARTLLYGADGGIRVTDLDAGTSEQVAFEATFRLVRPAWERKRFDFDRTAPRQALGIVAPALSPDGTRVAFQALNRLWLMDVGGAPRPLTDGPYYAQDPAWSRDGTRLAYASDKAGTADLYVLDVVTGAERRVTSLPGAEMAPAWSPDGGRLAFQDQAGATHVLDLATGAVRQVVAPLFAPGRPTWSADGRTLALAALKPYTRRFREGTSQILTVDVESGATRYQEPAPFESLSTRGDDGPVWSPDGTALAFVMQSTLWVMPVDAAGRAAGPAVRITSEPTDAPTWSGDSRRLLYLSNGALRMVAREGGAPATVPVELRWRQDRPEGTVLVHAGRLWDGRGPEVRHDVDLVVAGNRIRAILPHRADAHARAAAQGQRVVDASGLTAIPGLWESHTHEWISGKFYGARLGRLWLSYGVTSAHSVGDPDYRAVETREAYASGARVGPRFFASGEAIDGERVYYNFMRPTTSAAQLDLELARAKALDYDMLKTYVRMQHEWQAKAVRFAHEEMGVWVGSHYMLPGMSYGMDGQTHVSATTRLGFAYTRSSGGVSYGDVRTLFARSGMFDISTTFNPSLYADDPAMVDDPRLLALNTPWDQALLRAKRDRAVTTDQTVSLETLQREEETLAAVLRGGGTMLAGTDSPLDNVATALHLNLRAQVKLGGLAPWEALRTATALPARAFGVDADLGTLEAGKLADVVFVRGDPLADVADVANVELVMKNGRLHTVAELMAPFTGGGAAAASAPAHRRLPAARGVAVTPARWWHDPEAMVEEDHR